MSAETVLCSTLVASAGVGALIDDRIYPDLRPQDDPAPAIVYRRDGTVTVPTIHGTIALTRAQLSVICVGTTRGSAEAVADAAQTALLAAGFLLVDRGSEFEVETLSYIATLTIEHLS